MPEGLESVISGAIESAGLEIGDSTVDPSDTASDDTPAVDAAADSGDDALAGDAAADEGTGDGTPAADAAAESVAAADTGKPQGPIPFAQHKKILENARTETTTLRTENESLKSQLQTYGEERAAYGLADSNPDLFAKVMLEDPKISAAIHKALGTPAAAGPAGEKDTPAPAARPKPDRLLDDGSAGYSQEAMDALLAFERDSLSSSLTEKFNKLVSEKFGLVEPLVQEHQAGKMFEAARVRMSGVVEDARNTWPGFKDHESEIKAWLAKPENGRATLEEAWRRVAVPKLQQSRDDQRVEILKELEGREAAVQSVNGPRARKAPDKTGPRTTEDVIKQSIANAGLSI